MFENDDWRGLVAVEDQCHREVVSIGCRISISLVAHTARYFALSTNKER